MANLTDDELLLDGTPEQIAALEAKYGEGTGDFELPGDSREGFVAQQQDPAAQAAPATPAVQASPPAADPAAAPAQASAAEPADIEKVAGVATKDGTGVLPYTVLRATRREAATYRTRLQSAEQELARTKEQLEALKAGKTLPTDGAASGEPDLDAVLLDFPQLAGLVTEVKGLRAKAAPAAAQADPAGQIDQELDAQEELDAALAQRPVLSTYSQTGGVVWARAIEIDRELLAGEYASKPVAERLAETEKRLAKELGIQLPQKTQQPPPALDRADTPPQDLPRVIPNTLSDVGGGRAPTDELSQLGAMRGDVLAARFSQMSDEEMDRVLARSA